MRAPPRRQWASRRPGLRVRIACSAASPSAGGDGAAYGRSEPWQTTSMPSTRIDGVDRLRAVGRGLDERERVDRAAAAAAGAVALAVQRAEPGERGEADGQLREAVAAAVAPGPPGGVQLGDVRARRAPTRPGGRARPGARRGRDGRAAARVRPRARRAAAPGGRARRARRARRPRPRARSRRARATSRSAAGSGIADAGHRPGAERAPAARARPRARRRRARAASAGGSRSRPSEAAGATHTSSSPSAAACAARASGSWSPGAIGCVRSPRQVELPAVQPRRAPARAQRGQERLGPEMLMEVGGHASEAIH